MKRKQNKQNRQARTGATRAAGLASATFGRARTFKNRKKDAARKACRKPVAYKQ